MKKKIELSGSLKEMVTYCTAIYELDSDVDAEMLNDVINNSRSLKTKDSTQAFWEQFKEQPLTEQQSIH